MNSQLSTTCEKEKKKIKQPIVTTFTDFRIKPPEPTLKTASGEKEITTYILSVGEYSRRRIILVSHDVKKVAKIYVDHLYPSYESPNIEVWKHEKWLGDFFEIEQDASKVWKKLSKMSMKIK